jgi:hypothetical protein
MKAYILSNAQQAQMGFTHRFEVPFTDLNTTAGTSLAVVLAPYVAGRGVTGAAFKLVTPFDGGATSALAMDVGHNGATTDDPDSLLDNYEVHADATEILYGDGNGAVFATLRTGYFPQDAGNYEATFTATGGILTLLTQGEVHIYLNIVDLSVG